MLKAVNISKSFDGKPVLKNISTVFEQGKINMIIGKSGSGKTVLLKSLLGIFDIDQGQICYDDVIYNELSEDKRRTFRTLIGVLFQGSALFDFATVFENVLFPLQFFSPLSKEEQIERVKFCLNRVNLNQASDRYPSELSGGMQKRVAIARAISLNPKYLFCDEPNSGLDPQTALVIDALIKEITEEYNITTIVNTHDMNSVLEIGEHIIFIHEGEKWWEGTHEDILRADNEELNQFIFANSMAKKMKKMMAMEGVKDKTTR